MVEQGLFFFKPFLCGKKEGGWEGGGEKEKRKITECRLLKIILKLLKNYFLNKKNIKNGLGSFLRSEKK